MTPQVQPINSGDLLSCDREPIHLLGRIQSMGFLVSVNADWFIVRASENVVLYLDVEYEHLLGRSALSYIPASVLHDIRGCLQLNGDPGVVGRLFGQKLKPQGPSFDIAVHRSGIEYVLEFEESVGEPGGSLSDLRFMIAGVERQSSAQALVREAARHIRAFTGFDRVMIYRFDEDGSGEVIAESAKSGLSPFVGLHFPASDIPVQARALYERNYLRAIADVEADTVAVMPILSPMGQPLDFSMSMLRSVSPIHIEYLKNMGVRSSMSISILRSGKLWGLIACHHGLPKPVNFEMRSTAELFGQMFSFLLDEHLRADDDITESLAQEIHGRIGAAFVDLSAILNNLSAFLAGIIDYIPADGVGVYVSGEIGLSGVTPNEEGFRRLIGDLNQTTAGVTFSTDKVASIFPNAARNGTETPGILAIPFSGSPRAYLIFFRKEMLKTVAWAGEPVAKGATTGLLTPRSSFQAWQEIIRGRSTRWTVRERRLGEALRGILVERSLVMSDTAHSDRIGAGQRQEILIAELNHRNKNILGLVRGLITQSAASAVDVTALVESLDDRIRSLASAHDILTSANWKPSSLHNLVRAEISTYSQSDASLELIGPDVLLQPQVYSAMAMVIHELVTNARKYGALSVPDGMVFLTSNENARGDTIVSWRETDGPPVNPPTRRGFGSTILEQAVPFEVGGISIPKYLPEGFELELVLPSAVASCVASVPSASMALIAVNEDSQELIAFAEILRTTLIVEDNLFIAIDAEDMLRRLGAGTTEIVKTVSDALNAVAECNFSFALLDVNLGVETSLPVALALKAREIPFVFGTGYGEALGMPATLKDVSVIAKPYSRQATRAVLTRIADAVHRPNNAPKDQSAISVPTNAISKSEFPDSRQMLLRIASPTPLLPLGAPQPRVGHVPDAHCFVAKLENLAPMSVTDKVGLLALTKNLRSLSSGADIVSDGGYANGLYIVLEGFACRYKLASDGARQITSYLLPGDFCDFSSIPGRISDALGTMSPCTIANVSPSNLKQAMLDHPSLANAFHLSALVDQAIAREWLMCLGRRSAESRLAHLFCELMTRMRDIGAVRENACILPLTQYDIGDTVGLSLVHVNRTLQSLRQRNLIIFKSKILHVVDFVGLASLAGFKPDYLHPNHPEGGHDAALSLLPKSGRSQWDELN